jgi:hypothetical protein
LHCRRAIGISFAFRFFEVKRPTGNKTDYGRSRRAEVKNMGLILLIVLILLLIGAVPSWPYSRNWGYWPSGGLGLVVVIVLILLLLGRI